MFGLTDGSVHRVLDLRTPRASPFGDVEKHLATAERVLDGFLDLGETVDRRDGHLDSLGDQRRRFLDCRRELALPLRVSREEPFTVIGVKITASGSRTIGAPLIAAYTTTVAPGARTDASTPVSVPNRDVGDIVRRSDEARMSIHALDELR